jgi:hypothetical protein
MIENKIRVAKHKNNIDIQKLEFDLNDKYINKKLLNRINRRNKNKGK